jgi:hypothetical protein
MAWSKCRCAPASTEDSHPVTHRQRTAFHPTDMSNDLLVILAFAAVWIALTRWILPRFGIPT